MSTEQEKPKPRTKEERRIIVDAIVKELIEEGRLIQGGWAAFHLLLLPEDAPEVQVQDMRMAFFAGAQHLFSSIIGMLDASTEPTDQDMARMSKIDVELKKFVDEMNVRMSPEG